MSSRMEKTLFARNLPAKKSTLLLSLLKVVSSISAWASFALRTILRCVI